MKDCIPHTAPYLRHTLKLDNLSPICKHLSEQVLHNLNVGGTAPMSNHFNVDLARQVVQIMKIRLLEKGANPAEVDAKVANINDALEKGDRQQVVNLLVDLEQNTATDELMAAVLKHYRYIISFYR